MTKLHNLLRDSWRPFITLLALLTFAVLSSGCSIASLKEREQQLAEQQQELALEQQQLALEQQELAQEKSALQTLQTELEQEKKRLEILKKQPTSNNTPTNRASGTAQYLAKHNRMLVGELEYIYISPPDVKLTARIDTGAKTSSLNAQDLVEFERDGKSHVRFHILEPKTGEEIEIERRIIKWVRIKEHEGDFQRRPIVKMRVRLGELDQHIEMTLADRSEFDYQALIGRNYLRDFAIVDVSKKFLSQPVVEKN